MSDSHTMQYTDPLVVMGIDPGTLVVGYGAVVLRGKEAVLLAAGVVRTTQGAPISTRLAHIRTSLDKLLGDLKPQVVVIEKAFAGKNMASALRIGEGRGVALACAALSGAQVEEYTPAEVKKSLTGNGGADKAMVARWVAVELGSPAVLQELRHDATDGLALALTWARRRHLAELGLR
ncbi:MAG: crossover junction endodeoxyribonuclease RuvC [Planctomycetes bacterium]|nr:crossover junction endodeoxyribonuclease RuvC [Planctomycetota bacterium]